MDSTDYEQLPTVEPLSDEVRPLRIVNHHARWQNDGMEMGMFARVAEEDVQEVPPQIVRRRQLEVIGSLFLILVILICLVFYT